MAIRTNMTGLAAGFAALLLAAPALATNLVSDGDFTVPSGGGSFVTYGNGSSMGPWSVTGSVDLIGAYWQAPNGVGGSVDLDGDHSGAIAQGLSLIAGRKYELTFYVSANPDGGDPVKSFNVSVGSLDQNYTYDRTVMLNSRADMKYTQISSAFFATGSDTLKFISTDASSSAYGAVIGGVSVSAVPEASTWAMMLIGFAGLGFAGHRASRRSALAKAL